MSINAEHVPELNRLTVLKSINQQEPFTRMDVVRKANLSLPTVNNILAGLIDEGYIVEIGSDRPRGGRPPTLYRFNPQARYAIGIEIKIPQISIGLVDLQEKLVALDEYAFGDDTIDTVIPTLQNGISKILAAQKVDTSKLVGIGLGVPGFVDRETGTWLRYTRLPQVRDIPVASSLADAFNVPIFTQNESNVYALAEMRYGILQPGGDMVFVTWSEGVKASVVIDGQILSGRFGNFGAIGHFIVVENGRTCYCGAKGCLEMYASGYAFREALKAEQQPAISQLQPDEVFKRAAEGDPFCRNWVEQALPYTAYAFAGLIRLTDIHQLILLGAYVDGGDYLLNLLYDSIAERLPGVARRNLALHLGSKQPMENIVAAAAVPAIEAHFKLQTSP